MKSLMNLVVSALIELNLEILQPIPTAQHNMQSLMNLVSALSCDTAS